ncbi:MAG: hypothetical protein CJBNEKGG_04035 [Prosthecobacter sp.]|nr:hypothetical protein [Prosthecobacter sp.]
MSTNPTPIGPHSLGDVTAEIDKAMLNRAFFETRDYFALQESAEHCIIVGRRGTGKSALCYKLGQHWGRDEHNVILRVSPEDHQLILLRHYVGTFGTSPNLLRAAAKTFWRYAIILEVADLCQNFRDGPETAKITLHLSNWRKSGTGMFERLGSTLSGLKLSTEPDLQLPTLVKLLEVDDLQQELNHVLTKTRKQARVLVDRLDEGFEPTASGVAVIGGAALAATLLNAAVEKMRVYIFVRDNIARAIAESDMDYSRNLESRVLRLHWEEQSLFYMICRRLRAAFAIDEVKDLRVWDAMTHQDVRGREGFRKCLRLTLYRPRDLILLLNKALYRAGTHGRRHVDNSDINASAREISENRKRDLVSEYSSSIPGLDRFVDAFKEAGTTFTYPEAVQRINSIFDGTGSAFMSIPAVALQTARIIGDAGEVVRLLYSVGFLGVTAEQGTSFIFSHDGKSPLHEFKSTTKLLVHPCYWLALNLQEQFFGEAGAAEIHDDLDLEVITDSTEIRNRKLGQLISELDSIEEGAEDAHDFEDWCLRALQILFAGALDNIRLHPNKTANQRRDIVARNTESTPFWKRILTDYGCRQVIFEIKNYSDSLGPTEFRQMASYLGQAYGRIGFIVNRAEGDDLRKGAELDWFRELYYHDQQKKVVIKLPAKIIATLLSKLRSPEKYSAADKRLNKLLDTYETIYLAQGGRGR